MEKRAIIIHGWDGHPEEDWFQWLKSKLEERNFQVHIPKMPKPETPDIRAWISRLSKVVNEPDENTYLIGHSIGCQTILRYLEELPSNKKIGGVVFVAGWLTLSNLSTEDEKSIAKPWLETPIDFEKVKQHTDQFFAIFSDNDVLVPAENYALLKDNLGAVILVKPNQGHFSGNDGVTEIPEILDIIEGIGNKTSK